MNTDFDDLKYKWQQLKSYQPELTPATVAEKLKVSELELFYSIRDEKVKVLNVEFHNFFKEFEKAEKLKITVRHNGCIQEISGGIKLKESSDEFLQIENERMSLKIQFLDLKYVLSVEDESDKSFRFFDEFGVVVLRIAMQKLDEELFDELIKKYGSENQNQAIKIEPVVRQTNHLVDEINISSFHNDWKDLERPEEFSQLLKKYNLSTWQATQYAPNAFFIGKIKNRKLMILLEEIAETDISVIINVENSCCSQSYKGKFNKTSVQDKWFNLFYDDFGFHLDTSKVIECKIIRKPSNVGIVTSVACFDGNNELIFEISCNRKEGEPELNEWRVLLNQVEEKEE